MNSVFVFVLCIVAIVMTAGVIQTYLKQEKKNKSPDTDSDADEMLEVIDRLEKRIQVLERIVTEKHVDLKQKIDEL